MRDNAVVANTSLRYVIQKDLYMHASLIPMVASVGMMFLRMFSVDRIGTSRQLSAIISIETLRRQYRDITISMTPDSQCRGVLTKATKMTIL